MMCSAFIPVAPPARPFRSFPTTVRTSESVGMTSEISKCGKRNGRAHPIGGARAYNSTRSAVCLTMVSGHAGGGRSSADLYHPFRARHASFTAPLLRWLSTVEAAFAARCLRSAVSNDLISRPIRRARQVVRCPFLRIVARLSTTAQVLSDIHRLAGRSLTGGGLRPDGTPRTCSPALHGVPGGF